jgi:hypothetical protein
MRVECRECRGSHTYWAQPRSSGCDVCSTGQSLQMKGKICGHDYETGGQQNILQGLNIHFLIKRNDNNL